MNKLNITLMAFALYLSFSACQKPTDDPVPANKPAAAPHPAGTFYSNISLTAYHAPVPDYCSNSPVAQLSGVITTYDANGNITNTQTFSNIPGNAQVVKDCTDFLVNSGINYEFYYAINHQLGTGIPAGVVNNDCSFTYKTNGNQMYENVGNAGTGNSLLNQGYMHVVITDPNTHQVIASPDNHTIAPGFIFSCFGR